ncbi:MAG: hypothetical protein K6G54_07000, partial [Oscillospiraceae bacterium]|nr:hypothetical protein [Oscillospiraceae bacterium]
MFFRRMKQTLALILTAALLLPMLPPEALAHYADSSEKPTVITTTDGATTEITEEWETAFPYGTFAFGNSEAQVTEGGETAVIHLYRLGGTKGRATARVVYVPATVYIAEDTISYGNAAGADDVLIEVEDPLPIAQYQPLGVDPAPEPTAATLSEAESTDAAAQPGDRVIALSEPADSYCWYVLSDGAWESVEGAAEATLVVSAEDLAQWDVRCVFTRDGVRYCTDSLKGVAYEAPEAEVLEEIPADLPLNPESGYTAPEWTGTYEGCVFDLTFAEDEWVKDIRVTAVDDETAEAIKAGTFTIVDCEGGSLYDSANTLALAVFDNDAPEESVIGFSLAQYAADKADGKAVLTVTRTGGTQTMVTVPYSTKDGSARAGEDYQAVSGSLAFFADVTEQTIEIPLIDSGESADEPLTFRVELGDVVGDRQGLVTLEQSVATVSLTSSGAAETENLATMLRDDGAVDASATVTEAERVAAPVDRQVVTGAQVIDADEPLCAEIVGMGDSSELSLQTYDYGAVRFSRYYINNYDSNYWKTTLLEAGSSYLSDANSVGAVRAWKGDGSDTANGGHKIEGQSGGKSASLSIPYLSQMFESVSGVFYYGVSVLDSSLYGAEFVYPWAAVTKSSGGNAYYTDAGVSWSGNLFKGYKYRWSGSGSINQSFAMNSALSGVTIGLSRHDAHNGDKGTAKVDVNKLTFVRRSLTKDMKLRIHTANDGESGDGNVVTAPQGGAALTVS